MLASNILSYSDFSSFPSVLGGNAQENLNYQNLSTSINPSMATSSLV
ncbi:hypothetical protein ACLHDG_00525 [Sulfurovum sp. CS9]